jgi:hypothetical protein
VGSALVIVLSGFAVLQDMIRGADRAAALEHGSQILMCWSAS